MRGSNWCIWDYVQDITGIIVKSFYGSTIVLSILWVAGIIGLFSSFIPELKELLYSLSSLGNTPYLLILLLLIPFDIFYHRERISSRLKDCTPIRSTTKLWLYIMWTIVSIGFGVIFGTLGLFAGTTKNFYDYMFVVIVSLSFSNIAGIIARGYIRDSPVAEFFLTPLVKKFPRLGFFW